MTKISIFIKRKIENPQISQIAGVFTRQILGTGAMVAALSLLVIDIGRSQMAQYANALNNIMMISAVANLGFLPAIQRFHSRDETGSSALKSFIVASVTSSALCFVSFLLPIPLHNDKNVLIVLFGSIIMALSVLSSGLYLSLGHYRFYNITELFPPLSFLMTMLIFRPADYRLAIILLVAPHAVKTIFATIHVFALSNWRVSTGLPRTFWSYTAAVGIFSVLNTLSFRLLLPTANVLAGARTSQSIAAAWPFLERVNGVAIAINTVLFRYVARGEVDSKKALLMALVGGSVAAGGVLALSGALGSFGLLRHQEELVGISGALLRLSPLALIWIGRSVLQNVLVASGRNLVTLSSVSALLATQGAILLLSGLHGSIGLILLFIGLSLSSLMYLIAFIPVSRFGWAKKNA